MMKMVGQAYTKGMLYPSLDWVIRHAGDRLSPKLQANFASAFAVINDNSITHHGTPNSDRYCSSDACPCSCSPLTMPASSRSLRFGCSIFDAPFDFVSHCKPVIRKPVRC